MIKKVSAAAVALMILTAVCSAVLGAYASPGDNARASVVIDAYSGDILFEKNAHERMGPASTTKIMTALVALEKMSPTAPVTVDARAVGTEGSSVYLCAGDKTTLSDLLYAMMLASANDAAAAIAYAVAGGIPEFAELMNEKARSLGCKNTHFENPHGLDGEFHFTTAYELATIARAALENEELAKIVSTKTKTVSFGDNKRTLKNHNRLLFCYQDIIGLKTGFTKKCGRTLVSAARHDDVTLICVTLCDGDDWRDHRKLLDAAFELYENKDDLKDG